MQEVRTHRSSSRPRDVPPSAIRARNSPGFPRRPSVVTAGQHCTFAQTESHSTGTSVSRHRGTGGTQLPRRAEATRSRTERGPSRNGVSFKVKGERRRNSSASRDAPRLAVAPFLPRRTSPVCRERDESREDGAGSGIRRGRYRGSPA